MSMIKKNEGGKGAQAAGTPAPQADVQPAAAAAPADVHDNPAADEGVRFQNQAQRPDYIPEKFWRDGAPDIENMAKSYAELTAWKNTKTEELMKQLDAERLKARPEAADKYEIPDIEGVDKQLLAESPLVAYWRETAFNAGLPQEAFNEGIAKYMEALDMTGPNLEEEAKVLGENAEARIAAVSQWAQAQFTDPAEFEAIQRLGQSAAGIKVLERMMGNPATGNDNVAVPKVVTIEQLKQMQLDPRYWNPASRDPQFVKDVDEGFQRLYGAKRA